MLLFIFKRPIEKFLSELTRSDLQVGGWVKKRFYFIFWSRDFFSSDKSSHKASIQGISALIFSRGFFHFFTIFMLLKKPLQFPRKKLAISLFFSRLRFEMEILHVRVSISIQRCQMSYQRAKFASQKIAKKVFSFF